MARKTKTENADYLVQHASGMQEWVGPVRLAELGDGVTVIEERAIEQPEVTPATTEDVGSAE